MTNINTIYSNTHLKEPNEYDRPEIDLTYTGQPDRHWIGYGNSLDNVITGGNSNKLYGEAGNDTLIGGFGTDHLFGGAGNDTLIGGGAYDTLSGGEGADFLDGGDGRDIADYTDSQEPLTFDLRTNTFTGIAEGDTYSSIEIIRGSKYNDVFIGEMNGMTFEGLGGVNLVTYAHRNSAIEINKGPNYYDPEKYVNKDGYYQIQIIEGTKYADSMRGSMFKDNFIGGAGADHLDGDSETDGAWYLTSPEGVNVDLSTGTGLDGHAEGDTLKNIENLMGSSFNDTLVGDAGPNKLEGGWGSDVIHGGAGDDTIYGGIYTNPGVPLSTGPVSAIQVNETDEADMLFGGYGNDRIYSSNNQPLDVSNKHLYYTNENDKGTIIHGEQGNDGIVVSSATAYGDEGSDELNGYGSEFKLYGGEGYDVLAVHGSGFGDGGQDGDLYHVFSNNKATIKDSGTSGSDSLKIWSIPTAAEIRILKDGADAHIVSRENLISENLDSGVVLQDWFAGSNTIETFAAADGTTFAVPASI